MKEVVSTNPNKHKNLIPLMCLNPMTVIQNLISKKNAKSQVSF